MARRAPEFFPKCCISTSPLIAASTRRTKLPEKFLPHRVFPVTHKRWMSEKVFDCSANQQKQFRDIPIVKYLPVIFLNAGINKKFDKNIK
jgi:hypothetical protein